MRKMEKNIKITIITVSLNAVQTIEQTIRSVLDQSYPNLEYIIIDGGSTDGTLEIIDNYRKNLALVISERDDGIYSAFNKGLRRASGDLIGILNADDLYAPWTLNTIAETYTSHPDYDIFYGKVVVLDENRCRWTVYPLGDPCQLFDRMSISHPAVFATKKTYEINGLFDETYKIAGDWDFLLRCLQDGSRFYPIDKVLTAFRNEGVSSGMSSALRKENKLIYSRYLNTLTALQKNLKMELKYGARCLLEQIGMYGKYADYRDGNIICAERSGTYGVESDFSWSVVE